MSARSAAALAVAPPGYDQAPAPPAQPPPAFSQASSPAPPAQSYPPASPPAPFAPGYGPGQGQAMAHNGYGQPAIPNGFGQAPGQPFYGQAPNGHGQVTAPSGYNQGAAPNGYGHAPTPAANGYGHAPAPMPNGYGPGPAPMPNGHAFAPGGVGQAPVPNGYWPAPAPNGFGQAPVPNGFGQAPVPNGFGQAPAPNGFGQAPAPNGFGQVPAVNGFGQAAPMPSYGQAPAWGAPQPAPVAPVAARVGGWGERARLVAAWMTLFLIGTDLFVISPLLPVVSERYQIDLTTAGWTLTAFSLSYMCVSPLLGGLSDRHGRRRVMVLGLLAFGIANFLTSVIAGLTDSFLALVLTRAAAGVSAAAISPSVYAATGDMAPPARRASWLAVVGSGLLIALALGAPLGGLIAAVLGMRAVFVIITFACFVLAVLNSRAWPSGGAPVPPPGAAAGAGPPAPTTLLALIGAVGPTVLWSTSFFGAYTYLGGGLAAAAGATAADTALVIVFFGIGMVAGNLSGGKAADRFGSESVMSGSYLGLGICWFAVATMLVGARSDGGRLPMIAVGLSLASYSAQLFFPAQQARLARIFAARRGAALAWNNSALYLGMSLGSLVGGAIFRRSGYPMLLNALAAVAFVSALLLSSLFWRAQVKAARASLSGFAAPRLAGVERPAAPRAGCSWRYLESGCHLKNREARGFVAGRGRSRACRLSG